MTIAYPSGYYDRFDESKNYEKELFRADYVLQSAELNDLQSAASARLKAIADSLYNDGSIIRGCDISVDPDTGATIVEAGIAYLAGAARGIPSGTFTVATTGTVIIGIYLTNTIVTPTMDPTLKDPAVGVLNYAEPGAYRLQRSPSWGYEGQAGIPDNTDFFGIYTVIDGIAQPKETPPQLEAVAQAIARYDIQSSGSNYISSGMAIVWNDDDAFGNQVIIIGEGEARVNGRELVLRHAIRSTHTPTPDLATVSAESHACTGDAQVIELNHTPVASITLIIITREVVEEVVTRGDVPGGTDALAHTSVLSVSAITQGATTFTPTTDYLLTDDTIDWSPGGIEPSTGTTYKVTYRYTATYPDDASILGAFDDTTVTVNHGVAGTTTLVGYAWKMPRYDRIGIKQDGTVIYVAGVSHPTRPIRPAMPTNVLMLATLYQTWNAMTRYLTEDSVRMVPMRQLNSMQHSIDDLFSLIADYRLAINLTASDPSAKRGLFVDSFRDNSLRDIGIDQDAACVNNAMTLTVDTTVFEVSIEDNATLNETTPVVLIQQPYHTGETKVNPYMSFSLHATLTLTPSVDQWTIIINTLAITAGYWTPETVEKKSGTYTTYRWHSSSVAEAREYYLQASVAWASTRSADGVASVNAQNLWLNRRSGAVVTSITPTIGNGYGQYRVVNESEALAERLRPIVVRFNITGFGPGSPGEALDSFQFDGLTVAVRDTP